MSDRYFFGELELECGIVVFDGYAEIKPGAGWTIEDIYAGYSESNFKQVTDERLFNVIRDHLEKHHRDNIDAEFGDDLNKGLRRAA